jgi:hypothetical protein
MERTYNLISWEFQSIIKVLTLENIILSPESSSFLANSAKLYKYHSMFAKKQKSYYRISSIINSCYAITSYLSLTFANR